MSEPEHKVSGCPRCDAEAHEAPVEKRNQQEAEERVLSAGLVVAACVVLLGLWVGGIVLLSGIKW